MSSNNLTDLLSAFLQQSNPQLLQPQQAHDVALAGFRQLLAHNGAGSTSHPLSSSQLSYQPAPTFQPANLTGGPAITSSDALRLLTLLQQGSPQSATPSSTTPFNSQPPSQSTTLDKAVGALPDDERILVNTLSTRNLKGWTVREALEALHGVNNHTASSWKDYFLENYERLALHIPLANEEERHDESLSAATPRGRTASRTWERSASGPSKPPARRHSVTRSRRDSQSRGQSDSRARPPRHVRFSETPSRSPTPPPSDSSVSMNGKRFTEAEEEFLIKSVRRQLNKDPYVSFAQMAKTLAQKAPGRSVDSWRGHITMTRRADVDRMIADARDNHKRDDRDETSRTCRGDDRRDLHDTPQKMTRETDDDEPDTDEDILSMGVSGQPFTEADFRMAARYIASVANWDSTPSTIARWSDFAIQHPQRADKSWAQGYVNHHLVIDRLVSKYRARYARRKEEFLQTSPRVDNAVTTASLPPFHKASKRIHQDSIEADSGEAIVSGKRPRDSY
ncbi:hypothetical protein EVJ58_g2159 [Rhodofomes roseus]|uniref:Uncharacterized protein n=1 Tax=Rhodofomes roseus TaxID=34475 RepID=A0A4Y9YUD5_9APHY|nr:hypothetical protein EVJ58_g2159 [Rhodofomes roseus]